MKHSLSRAALALGLPVLFTLTLTQCEGVLDTSPVGELSSENFYQTPRDFEAASLGPYSAMLNMYWDAYGGDASAYILFLLPDDDVRPPHNSAHAMEEFNWLPTNGRFGMLWRESYKGIMRANVILQQLPRATGFTSEAQKARFEAEAKFMRGYFYFLLARHFGEVPLVTSVISTVDETRLGHSAPGEVWDLIESDLATAAQHLPPTWDAANKGRATRGAANALLGKVRLYRAQWFNQPAKYREAAEALNAVVASNLYQLVPDYVDNFRATTENNSESVFEIQFTDGNGGKNPWLPTDFGLAGNENVGAAGTGRQSVWGPTCGPGAGNCSPESGNLHQGGGQLHILPGLRDAFEAGDPRRFYTMFSDGDPYMPGVTFRSAWSVTGNTPAKYLRPIQTNLTQPILDTNNERVIRYADVLLMLAEAELLGNNNVGRATQLVNDVRRRARNNYQILHGMPAPAGLLADRAAVTHADIRHERRVELAMESHRYDDLVRWHRAGLINIATDVNFGNAQAQWNTRHLLKPIPQRELDNNLNLQQNPGY